MKAFKNISISKLLTYFELEPINRTKYYIEYSGLYFCLIDGLEHCFGPDFKQITKVDLFNNLIEFDEQLNTTLVKEELMLCDDVDTSELTQGLSDLKGVNDLKKVIFKFTAKDTSSLIDIYIREGRKSILIERDGTTKNIIEFNDSIYRSVFKNDHNYSSLTIGENSHLTLAPVSIIYDSKVSELGEVIFFSDLTLFEKIEVLYLEHSKDYIDCYFNNNKSYNMHLMQLLVFRIKQSTTIDITLSSTSLGGLLFEFIIKDNKTLTEKLKQEFTNLCSTFFILNEQVDYNYISKTKVELFSFGFVYNTAFIIEVFNILFKLFEISGYNIHHLKNGIIPYTPSVVIGNKMELVTPQKIEIGGDQQLALNSLLLSVDEIEEELEEIEVEEHNEQEENNELTADDKESTSSEDEDISGIF
jgi:hypothetical protein